MFMSNDIRRGSSRFIAEDGRPMPMLGCCYTLCFLNIVFRHAMDIWTTDHFGVTEYSSNGGIVVWKCGAQ